MPKKYKVGKNKTLINTILLSVLSYTACCYDLISECMNLGSSSVCVCVCAHVCACVCVYCVYSIYIYIYIYIFIYPCVLYCIKYALVVHFKFCTGK